MSFKIIKCQQHSDKGPETLGLLEKLNNDHIISGPSTVKLILNLHIRLVMACVRQALASTKENRQSVCQVRTV